MHDAITAVTHASRRLPATSLAAAPPSRVRLVPVRRVTRAHLAVAARPGWSAACTSAAQRVTERLGAVLGCEVRCEFRLADATLHPFTHLAARALFVTVALSGDTLVLLELDLLGLGALLKHLTGSGELAPAPLTLGRIEEAAVGWLTLTALGALRGEPPLSALAPRLLSLTLDRGEALQQLDARRRHVALELDLGLGGTNAAARLLLPAQWLQARAEAVPAEPSPAPRPEVLAAGLEARCLLGGAVLGPLQATALERGDVVLLPALARGHDGLSGPGRLLTRSFELAGTFGPAGFTLTRALARQPQELHVQNADPTVPVEVEVELARVRIPLDQLGRVSPGHVLLLHVNAASQVLLRIGDRAVARAELVEVEGEVGARVTSML